jgi:hypothetical protein
VDRPEQRERNLTRLENFIKGGANSRRDWQRNLHAGVFPALVRDDDRHPVIVGQ